MTTPFLYRPPRMESTQLLCEYSQLQLTASPTGESYEDPVIYEGF